MRRRLRLIYAKLAVKPYIYWVYGADERQQGDFSLFPYFASFPFFSCCLVATARPKPQQFYLILSFSFYAITPESRHPIIQHHQWQHTESAAMYGALKSASTIGEQARHLTLKLRQSHGLSTKKRSSRLSRMTHVATPSNKHLSDIATRLAQRKKVRSGKPCGSTNSLRPCHLWMSGLLI